MFTVARFHLKYCIVSTSYKKFLLFLWYFGVCIGIFAGCRVNNSFYSLMHSSLCSRVSIVWVLISALIPYFLYLLLQRAWSRVFLACICFLKAFCYAFALLVIFRAFGSAGWLMCALCLWCDILSTVLLFWFLLNCDRWRSVHHERIFAFNVAVTIVLICINYWLVRPFCTGLLS